MKQETGDKSFPLWLIGDSEPDNWKEIFDTPFDPRHPIRHNIWMSVMDGVQDILYRRLRARIDTSKLYIRNAVKNAGDKPDKTSVAPWSIAVENEIGTLRTLFGESKPILVFTFGAFAYEFCRRCCGEEPYAYSVWNTRMLGVAFRESCRMFNYKKVNILPLLHRSISGGRFLSSHRAFCRMEGENYFEYTAGKIAEVIVDNDILYRMFID